MQEMIEVQINREPIEQVPCGRGGGWSQLGKKCWATVMWPVRIRDKFQSQEAAREVSSTISTSSPRLITSSSPSYDVGIQRSRLAMQSFCMSALLVSNAVKTLPKPSNTPTGETIFASSFATGIYLTLYQQPAYLSSPAS